MVLRFCAATLLVCLLTSCGEDEAPGADQPAPTSASASASSSPDRETRKPTPTTTDEPEQPTASGPSKAGARIVAEDSEFGTMLFDRSGQAIYLFDVETTSEPRCYDACADAWPPVLTTGDPVAGPGVKGSLLGTTERTDGTVQVTYNDHPLYFYAHEGRREVKCHDIFLNGGNWYVVQPGGDAAPPG